MMKMLLKRLTVIMTIFALFIAGGGRVLAEGLTGEDLDAILKDAPIHQTIGTGAVCGNDAALQPTPLQWCRSTFLETITPRRLSDSFAIPLA